MPDMNDIPDWTPEQVFVAICSDFETAWDAVAGQQDRAGMGRGNFMFTTQAMVLLEWACRLCAGDSTDRALCALEQALYRIRWEYFTLLPTSLFTPARDFRLPNSPIAQSGSQPLLWMLFDLVRNGLTHQYQQIVLRLSDAPVYVRLGGPVYGYTIAKARQDGPGNHVATVDEEGALGIVVKPAWLHMDFRNAVKESGILTTGVLPHGLQRSTANPSYRNLTAERVRQLLAGAGHKPTLFRTEGGSRINATMGTPVESVAGWQDVLGSTSGLVNPPPVLPDLLDQDAY